MEINLTKRKCVCQLKVSKEGQNKEMIEGWRERRALTQARQYLSKAGNIQPEIKQPISEPTLTQPCCSNCGFRKECV